MEGQIIQLENDEEKRACELLMMFEDQGVQYAALSDIDENDSVIIMKMIESEGEYTFETIGNELKAKELFVRFLSLWETEEDE